MDNQLLPLPQGEGRSFFNRYVVVAEAEQSTIDTIKAVNNKHGCAILCLNPLQPKFNLIYDETIHYCRHDRSNLFQVIVQFLLYMRRRNNNNLDGISLGKGGINISCIFGEKK